MVPHFFEFFSGFGDFCSLRRVFFLVIGADLGCNAAAGGELRGDPHPPGAAGRNKVIEDIVGQPFIEDALVAETLHIVFETLEFNALLVWYILNRDLPEIRLSGLWTDAGKLRAVDRDGIVPAGAGVVEEFESRFFVHNAHFTKKM
jgi:hypothetical protein